MPMRSRISEATAPPEPTRNVPEAMLVVTIGVSPNRSGADENVRRNIAAEQRDTGSVWAEVRLKMLRDVLLNDSLAACGIKDLAEA